MPQKRSAARRPRARRSRTGRKRFSPFGFPNAGLATAFNMQSPGPTVHRLRGRDLITASPFSVAAPVACVRIPCNPRFWPNTKAYQETLGWQCYTPKNLKVIWHPTMATTSAGAATGGSLTVQQSIPAANLSSALLSVPGSNSGPVWQEKSFTFDLSMLTQPRYFLNSTGDDGIPVCMYMTFGVASVTGNVEVVYDFEMSGACTAPVNIPLFDLSPRTVTTPASMVSSVFVLNSYTGLIGSNEYTAVWAGKATADPNIQLTATSGGGSTVAVDTSFLFSQTPVETNVGLTGVAFQEDGASLFLNDAGFQTKALYVFLQGAPN
jgi:hypothetical protein